MKNFFSRLPGGPERGSKPAPARCPSRRALLVEPLEDRALPSALALSAPDPTLSAAPTGNGASRGAAVSADGRSVAFVSTATNLVPGGCPGAPAASPTCSSRTW